MSSEPTLQRTKKRPHKDQDSNNDTEPTSQPPNKKTPETIDSQISLTNSRAYWESVNADNDGMLGGYEKVSTVDLRESKIFFTQVQKILGNNDVNNTEQGEDAPPKTITATATLAVDCGAGIGRITNGLLVKIADKVDIVEPIAKFAAEIERSEYKANGKVDEIFVQGLEEWSPPAGKKYGLIWNQWCVGHLTDEQLVEYLKRAAKGLTGCRAGEKGEKGWIMVKENINVNSGEDLFDEEDSSVTRTDEKFREIFERANLNLVRSADQKKFPSILCPVKMYALRPRF